VHGRDVDGDGDSRSVRHLLRSNILYRTTGWHLHDVTERAGVGCPLWSTSAAFADADGDGDLDLYVANYVDFRLENNSIAARTVRLPHRCHPKNFDSQPDVLYLNRGDGTFEDASVRSGIVDRTARDWAWSGETTTTTGRGHLRANDDTPNFLWRNRGNGTFDEVGVLAGVALSEDVCPRPAWAPTWPTMTTTAARSLRHHLAEESNELYHNDAEASFSDRLRLGLGLRHPEARFGTFFFDPDNTGSDLFVANGHIIDNIALYSDTITFEMEPDVYKETAAAASHA